MRQTFEDAARRRIARNKVERIRHLEASLGVIAILIADKVALLISDIGDDCVVGFDLDARKSSKANAVLYLDTNLSTRLDSGRMNKRRQLS